MKPEEIKPYSAEGAKGAQVEAMFDNIAPAYDFMNTAMTFGMHRRWLHKALRALWETEGRREKEGEKEYLDLATGTGEVALKIAETDCRARVTGVDLSEGMLEIARKKLQMPENAGIAGRVSFEQGDCLDLRFADATFDCITIAYGVRNFENLEKGFREFHRVLKDGGRLMVLELSRPENRVARLGYDLYSRTLIPAIGRLVSKDRRAYAYLPESIAAMPGRSEVARMLGEAGFGRVSYRSLTLGAVTYYIAEK